MPTITGTPNGEELGDTLGDDVIDALGGNDIVTVRNGADSVNGGAGIDTLVLRYGDTTFNVQGGVLSTTFSTGFATRQVAFTGFERFDIITGSGHDSIDTGSGDDVIRTGAGSDTIDAGAGNDVIDGGSGNDTMRGGAGDDVYVVDDYSDVAQEAAGQGSDEVQTALNFYFLSTASDLEKLTYIGAANFDGYGNDLDNVVTGGSGSDRLYGYGGNDRIVGGAGNDILSGDAGTDVLIGGSGNDLYYVESASDIVVELAGEGTDEVQTLIEVFSIAGYANVEKLTGTADGGFYVLTGNALNNEIRSAAANDRLDGGAGDDTLIGGRGSDVYIVDSQGDVVVENFDEGDGGQDEIRTSLATYDLNRFTYVERLVGTSTTGQTLTGNGSANIIIGGAGNDIIDGGGRSAGYDYLDGGAGNDFLRSSGDFNHMFGGTGNDTFELDSIYDFVFENPGEGIDEIRLMYAQFDMSDGNFANIERVTAGYNFLDYSIRGDGQTNQIWGNDGNDRLDGGAGLDRLAGGKGDDTYLDYVGDGGIDVFVEAANEGNDTIVTNRQAFNLAGYANIENLTGDRFDGQTLVGNALANTITGGQGHDMIDGAAGADVMKGGKGNDTYIVESQEDDVRELYEEGTDEIRTALITYDLNRFSYVENLVGTSNAGQTLLGNDRANRITGGAGDDIINGMGIFNDPGYDYLDGGDGNDFLRSDGSGHTFVGGKGNDVFEINSIGCYLIEQAGEGVDEIRVMFSGFDMEEYASHANIEIVTAGYDHLDYRIHGDGQDNIIRGANAGDYLVGRDGNDQLSGKGGNDELSGGFGNDLLDGGAGNDTMNGAQGDDVYVVDSLEDVVGELADEGTDEVRTSLGTYTLAANVENLTFTGTDAYNLRGNALSNVVTGGTGLTFFYLQDGGDDRVISGGGPLYAYFGDALTVNDKIAGSDHFDQIILQGQIDFTFGAGMLVGVETIALVSGMSTHFGGATGLFDYNLIAHDSNLAAGKEMVVDARDLRDGEHLVFDGSAETDGRFTLLGGKGNDRLVGGAGNDEFIPSIGEDVMIGGLGNDIYSVNSAGDQVVELAGQGTDLVITSLATYALGANFEDLYGSFVGNQLLIGNIGANTIRGNGGGDTLKGLHGHDVYVVVAGDIVIEAANEGIDRVETALATYMLTANVENLTGLSATGQNLRGNDINNRITGLDGNDRLEGFAGNDHLVGGGGRDILIGGAGGDLLEGGLGNDAYYADSFDTIRESVGGGIDTIYADVSLGLIAGQEVEVLSTFDATGTQDINFTGNEFNNNLIGNEGINWLNGGDGADSLQSYGGNDRLDGGAGGDTMEGGLGNDTYYVDNALDRVRESTGAGSDRVYTTSSYTLAAGQEIELLSVVSAVGTDALDLTGNEFDNSVVGNNGANVLRGGAGADTLQGNAGNDVLDGGLGADILTGGAGADDFLFSSVLGNGNIDRIAGFEKGSDQIHLARSIFAKLGLGELSANAFVAGSAATGADHRIVYDKATGDLFYDGDGSGAGAAVHFATLQPNLALNAADFFVV